MASKPTLLLNSFTFTVVLNHLNASRKSQPKFSSGLSGSHPDKLSQACTSISDPLSNTKTKLARKLMERGNLG